MSQWFFRQFVHDQVYSSQNANYLAFNFLTSILVVYLGISLILLNLDFGVTFPHNQDRAKVNETNFSPSVVYWVDQIEKWADTFALDPVLIATVMQIESCGDPQALSSANAHGLFQVMPYHFNQNENMLDPQTNALRGLSYLSEAFIKANGDIKRTLAGYNGGHGQITSGTRSWPDETRRYVYWGVNIYQEALSGKNQGETLKAWLSEGGWLLCQQAEEHLGLE